MADFPKPPSKPQELLLPSKAHLVAQTEERERLLRERFEELAELEKQLQEEREQLEARRIDVEAKSRALVENELLFKNQKLLYQKQFSRLMEQNELVQLRQDLDEREQSMRGKEEFLRQTEKRLTEQLSAREEELAKREAWISAEHEKATLKEHRRLQAIVFTDVVSYSARMQTDEGRTIQRVQADLQRMQAEGKGQGGMLINTMGDGMLMIFPSAIQAVRFSLGMQRAFNQDSGEDALRHRFGIHIADVALLPDGGIAGDGVNIASRLESKAPSGGICLSAVVHTLIKGKILLPPGESEQVVLKNIAEPMAVYKFPPEAILAMADPHGSAPPEVQLADEERTVPPFAFPSAAQDSDPGASGFRAT